MVPAVMPIDRSGLAVRVLGGFHVVRDGAEVPPESWPRRKSRELLWLLCAQSGRSLSRESAGEQLWPDAGPQPPWVRLRVTLHALNETLEPNRPPRTPTRFVRATADHVRLDPAVWLDIDEFRHLARLARAEAAPGRALLLARAALDHYRGPFLADSPHLEWAHAVRNALQTTFVDLALHGGRAELTHGRAPTAAELARAVLAVDPYRETAYRLLAQAHLATDDAAAARAVFATCRDRLVADLGVGPSWSVDALVSSAS